MLITLALASRLAALAWGIGVMGDRKHICMIPQKSPLPIQTPWHWTQPRLGNAAKHQDLTKTAEKKLLALNPDGVIVRLRLRLLVPLCQKSRANLQQTANNLAETFSPRL